MFLSIHSVNLANGGFFSGFGAEKLAFHIGSCSEAFPRSPIAAGETLSRLTHVTPRDGPSPSTATIASVTAFESIRCLCVTKKTALYNLDIRRAGMN